MNLFSSIVSVDECWMQHALQLARCAAHAGEVPVGAVVVREGQSVGEGWNQPIGTHDPTAHAEIIALRAAGRALSNYRLPGCTVYVTMEPCVMCAGAMVHARVDRLVFGAFDRRAGAVGSVVNVFDIRQLNHRLQVTGGVLADVCAEGLRSFFAARRSRT